MPVVTFTIDSKLKDKIIYKNGKKSLLINTQEFIKELVENQQKKMEEKWTILPPNCIAFNGKDGYRIFIDSYEDYWSVYEKDEVKKYLLKIPKLIVDLYIDVDKNGISYSLNKFKWELNGKIVDFDSPNLNSSCMGDYDSRIKDISKVIDDIKLFLTTPYTNDIWDKDKQYSFFEVWEKQGYEAAYKMLQARKTH